MTKLTRPLILSIIIMLVLASCGLLRPSTPTQVPLPLIQETQSIVQLAVITLEVQPDTSVPFTAVGQIIKYTLAVKKTGSVPAAGPAIITGATGACPDLGTIGNLDASLDTGEVLTCTVSYTITQADLDKGSVTIIFSVALGGINSNPVTITVPTGQPKVLVLAVTASPTNYDQAGQVITFTYTIKNGGTGNLSPGPFTVSGGYLGTTPLNCGDANTTLAPGQTLTCTSTYTTTQNDLAANTLTHQVTVSGGGAGPSQPASANITKGPVAQQPNPAGSMQHTVVLGEWLWQVARCYGVDPEKLAADNKARFPVPSQLKPGDVLLVNSPGSFSKYYGPTNCVTFVNHTLQSGDTWVSLGQKYNADPTILQLANTTVSLTSIGSVVKLRIPSYTVGITTVPSTQAKALTLAITANPSAYDQAGQVITFTYVIKNSGTETLGPDQFKVSGGFLGTTPLNCGTGPMSLTPGTTVTCTAPYSITQNDLAADTLTNQATASGGGAPPSPTASVTISKATKVLTLTVSANPTTFNQAGQVITFTYVIKNGGTGNLGPSQFTVNGGFLGTTPLNCGDATASLTPSQTVGCTSQYTITQNDLAADTLTHQVTASGGGAPPSQPASATLTRQ